MRAIGARALALLALIAPPGAACGAPAPARLAIERAGTWREFWRSDRAPTRWAAADSAVASALDWHAASDGIEWASLSIRCGAPAFRVHLIVTRLDPRRLRFALVLDQSRTDLKPAWTLDRAPPDARFAVNAGQFGTSLPWGWLMRDGRLALEPGHGPLSSAIAIDAGGAVTWAHGGAVPAGVRPGIGFQSFPTLLAGDGRVPAALRTRGSGVSLTHRDARLALGSLRDGRLLVVLTRFGAFGAQAEFVPWGPTTPEMAAILGALGARDAMLLDGGISAQMMIRDTGRAEPLRWRGLRAVPLALIAR